MTNQVMAEAPLASGLLDIVITRAHVFDGHEALPGLYDVGIIGREIAAVSATPLARRQVIDGAGSWVLPGLIDTRLHFFDCRVVTDPETLAEFVKYLAPLLLRQFLECGVTMIKSVGDPTTEILEMRAGLAAGSLCGRR